MRGLCSMLGGVALFLADYPVSQTWLMLVAFAPPLWGVLAAEACGYGRGRDGYQCSGTRAIALSCAYAHDHALRLADRDALARSVPN